MPRFEAALAGIRSYLALEPVVEAAVLFGSVARGEATPESDLDILLILTDPSQDSAIYRKLASICAHHDVTPSTLTTDSSLANLDRQVLDSIVRQGKPLKGIMPEISIQALELQPKRLIRFWLAGLDQARKVRLNRLLFGYESVKRVGRKVYTTKKEGVLHRIGGEQVGPATVLVPEAMAGIVERLLVAHGVKRWMIPVWEQAR